MTDCILKLHPEAKMEDNEALFTQAMADVRPLQAGKQVVYLSNASTKRDGASRVIIEEDKPCNILTREFLDILPLEQPLEYKQAGVQQGVLDKLRQGKYPLQASLNLLRKPVATCRLELFDFYCQSQIGQLRTLLIIHGRGREPQSHANIVRSYVNKWLQQLDQVQAFCRALPQDGGAGACYVALKKSPAAKQDNWERHAKHSR
jgi:DNA-nicking Smr family endonuclease